MDSDQEALFPFWILVSEVPLNKSGLGMKSLDDARSSALQARRFDKSDSQGLRLVEWELPEQPVVRYVRYEPQTVLITSKPRCGMGGALLKLSLIPSRTPARPACRIQCEKTTFLHIAQVEIFGYRELEPCKCQDSLTGFP